MEDIKIFRDGYGIMEACDRLVAGTATWRDVFMLPEALVDRGHRDLAAAVLERDSQERLASGYYTLEEYGRHHPDPSSVCGIRTDGETFIIREDFPGLRVVNGPCSLQGRRSLPVLEAASGDVRLNHDSVVDAPVLSLTGPLTISGGASLTAGALTCVSGNVSLYHGASLAAGALRYINGRCLLDRMCTFDAPSLEVVTGSMLTNGEALVLPALKLVNGDLDLDKGGSLTALALSVISGSCTLMEGSALDAPLLASVSGRCSIFRDAEFTAPSLRIFRQSLSADDGSRVTVPSLRSIDDDLILKPGAVLTAPALRFIGGHLSLRQSAQVSLPSLESVTNGCFIGSEGILRADGLISLGRLAMDYRGTAELPSLATIAGTLSVWDGASLSAPLLRSVADSLMVHEAGQLRLPSLESILGVCCVEERGLLEAPKLGFVSSGCLLHPDASVYAVALREVGGVCTLGERAVLDAPDLQSVGGVSLKDDAVLNAPLVTGAAVPILNRKVSVDVSPDWDGVLTRLSAGTASWQEVFMLPNSPLLSPDNHRVIAAVMNASRSERFAAGYYTLAEINGVKINPERIVGITDIAAPEMSVIFGEGNLTACHYPNLRYLNGTLQVSGNFRMKAPALEVSRACHLDAGSSLEAPALTSVPAFCFLSGNSYMNAGNLASVGGFLRMISACMVVPSLASVGAGVTLTGDSYLSANGLYSIKGSCHLMEGSSMIVPGLKEIGGDLRIYDSSLDAPSLLTIGGERKYTDDCLKAPLLDSLNGKDYSVAGQNRASDRIAALKPVLAPVRAKMTDITEKVSKLLGNRRK